MKKTNLCKILSTVVVICAGFSLVSCGTKISPNIDTKDKEAVINPIDEEVKLYLDIFQLQTHYQENKSMKSVTGIEDYMSNTQTLILDEKAQLVYEDLCKIANQYVELCNRKNNNTLSESDLTEFENNLKKLNDNASTQFDTDAEYKEYYDKLLPALDKLQNTKDYSTKIGGYILSKSEYSGYKHQEISDKIRTREERESYRQDLVESGDISDFTIFCNQMLNSMNRIINGSTEQFKYVPHMKHTVPESMQTQNATVVEICESFYTEYNTNGNIDQLKILKDNLIKVMDESNLEINKR